MRLLRYPSLEKNQSTVRDDGLRVHPMFIQNLTLEKHIPSYRPNQSKNPLADLSVQNSLHTNYKQGHKSTIYGCQYIYFVRSPPAT